MNFLFFGLVFAIALCAASAADRDALLKRAEDLETRAKAAVQKQKDAGKDVTVLEVEERRVAALAAEVRLVHPGVGSEVRLRMLEASLVTAESRLEATLKQVEGTSSFVKRDLKTDLLGKAAELLGKSGGIIKLLESQGKPLLAEGVRAVENMVKTLETKLQTMHPSSEIGKLALTAAEELLKLAENKLEEEIKKLGSALFKRDLKTDLLTRAAGLLTKSGPLIQLLETQGKPLLAVAVKEIDHLVRDLEAKLQNMHPTSEIGKLALTAAEEVLKTAENKLEAEMKKLGSALVKRDLKTDLLGKAAELLGKSGGIIKLLESQGKPLLAEGVRAVENMVKTLETKLQTMHPSSEIGKLALTAAEELLKLAENKLEEEIKKLGSALVKRDLKTDLLGKAAELLGKSGGIIKLLESQGKPLLAEGVRAVENMVKTLETKLETMHPSSEIGKLALAGAEELLKLAENKLEEEIKKLGAALF